MSKWEYCEIESASINLVNLNKMGSEGWELVHVTDRNLPLIMKHLYFKRKILEPQEVEVEKDEERHPRFW